MSLFRIIVVFVFTSSTYAQKLQVEAFFGNNNYRYQHSFSKELDNNFGFSHSSSLLEYYDSDITELMTQSYLNVKLLKGLNLGLGTFYASAPGFSPSLNLQFAKISSDWTVVVVPRIDLKERPSYDVMALIEYKPNITQKIKLYTRFQMMANYRGTIHNRGYQHFRIGINVKEIQVGLAAGFESYGKYYKYDENYGLFFRIAL